jgi:glucuronate isomerase
MANTRFLGENWLLPTKEAVWLYREVAVPFRAEKGILDTHTHHNLQQIVENEPFPNIWRAEVLETREEYANNDHYIIQLASKLPGFSQALARDPAISDRDKWRALARVFPDLAGNHVHQWLHLDLRRLFDIHCLLSEETGDEVWARTGKRLRDPEMLPQSILRRAGVKVIFTTDDPAADLRFHVSTQNIHGMTFLPTFRPDAYCHLFKDTWRADVERLCRMTGQDTTLRGLVQGLRARHEHFVRLGARASDHGLPEPFGLEVSESRAARIFTDAIAGKAAYNYRSDEAREFISYMMHQFCGMNREHGLVTQIHYGVYRNANRYLCERWGADVGGDVALEPVGVVENLIPLLSRFFAGAADDEAHLILYPMNQAFEHINITLERAFPGVHAGFPWWHNDTPYVMEHYLLHSAGASLLSSSGGPVCDGRKVLSQGSRFEVFDRVICRAVGTLVADGQLPRVAAARAVKSLMFENQARIFGLA